jgi:hypothetical protein
MLTQQEKEYIDLSIASGLGEESVLRSFLQQSGWSEEKIDSALAYAFDILSKNVLTDNPYLTKDSHSEFESAQEKNIFNEELNVSLPGEGESIKEETLSETRDEKEADLSASLVSHFSELEKEDSRALQINREQQEQVVDENGEVPTTMVVEEDRPFFPQPEKSFSQGVSPKQMPSSEPALVMAHDENGEQHSIFHLVMIFLLIFFVLVVCVVGLLFWLDVGPFSSVTYTKIK